MKHGRQAPAGQRRHEGHYEHRNVIRRPDAAVDRIRRPYSRCQEWNKPTPQRQQNSGQTKRCRDEPHEMTGGKEARLNDRGWDSLKQRSNSAKEINGREEHGK